MMEERSETLPNLLAGLVSEHGDGTALICDGEELREMATEALYGIVLR